MADINALYPQPQKQDQGNLLSGDPSKIIGLANALQTYSGRNAIGDIYRQNIRPDGTLDEAGVIKGIKGSPQAGWMAPEAVGGALTREQQRIANTKSQFDLDAAQYQHVINQLGTLADKKNPTGSDVHDVLVRAARTTNIPSARLTAIGSELLRDPATLQKRLLDLRKQSIGSAGVSGEAPLPVDASGAARRGTVGQFLESTVSGNGNSGNGGPGIQTGLSPSAQSAATVSGGAGAGAAVRLREAADLAPNAKAMLGNLEEDLKGFTSGPAADWTKVAKAWTNRNVPLPKDWQFDPKSIASQEQFTKQAYQLAQQQFAAIGGTGTDAKFSSAFETNPHETLSHLGNEGIIRLLKGNQDAISAKYKAWQQYRKAHGPDSYDDFSEEFNSSYDPRVFQFKYMSKADRQKYVDRMDDKDRGKFLQDLHAARKRGWSNATD